MGARMTSYQIKPDHQVRDEATLRALFAPTHPMAALKSLTALDAHAMDFIRRAPFLCIGTQNTSADVSPRGDPAGFVQILDPHTIAIPDRPGNNRLDTLSNIIANPHVGLLFMIPGFDDTLRLNEAEGLQIEWIKIADLRARMGVWLSNSRLIRSFEARFGV